MLKQTVAGPSGKDDKKAKPGAPMAEGLRQAVKKVTVVEIMPEIISPSKDIPKGDLIRHTTDQLTNGLALIREHSPDFVIIEGADIGESNPKEAYTKVIEAAKAANSVCVVVAYTIDNREENYKALNSLGYDHIHFTPDGCMDIEPLLRAAIRERKAADLHIRSGI